jgi:hypothetical protein
MNHVVDVLRTRQLIPEVMEEVGRDGAEDRERQCGEPGLPAENDEKAAARLHDRRQHGENVRIRQALRGNRRGRRAEIHEFLDAGTDEDNRDQDPADGQDRNRSLRPQREYRHASGRQSWCSRSSECSRNGPAGKCGGVAVGS